MKIEGDRLMAFLIVNGKVYESDCDHQECLRDYYLDEGKEFPYRWDYDGENWDNEHKKAISQTFEMKNSHKAYGFDLFDAADLDWVLIAHDKASLKANEKWAAEWANKNKAHIAYFTTGWDVTVVA